MKKQLFYPCTLLRPFVVALPMAALLVASILMNDTVDTLLKLYPMIIACSLGIIFTFVYFFKAIVLSKDEIKYIGPFSSRDSAVINEGKTLILTLRKNGKLGLALYGNNGENASLDWLKSETAIRDIYLFKGKAIGGVGAMSRTLEFFDVPGDDIKMITEHEEASLDYEDYSITASIVEGEKEVRLKFKKTL